MVTLNGLLSPFCNLNDQSDFYLKLKSYGHPI